MKAIIRYKKDSRDQEISFEEAQNILIETLFKFQKFCEAFDIPFSLTYGSLIGAVREQNIIKWDDDIDLMMSSEVSAKLFSKLDCLSEFGLKSYHYSNSSKCYSNEIRIYQDGFYRILEENGKEYLTPLCIDIFIFTKASFDKQIDEIPAEDTNISKIRKYKRMLILKNGRYNSKNKKNGIARNIARFVLLPITSKYLHNKIESIIKRMDQKKAYRYVFSPYANETMTYLFSEDTLNNLVKIKFNSSYSYAIKDYDSFLTRIYGNWKRPHDRSNGDVFEGRFLKRKE